MMSVADKPIGPSSIINRVFDEVNDAIKISGSITTSPTEVESIKNASDAVKTINWTDATKSEISTIVYVSTSLGKTLTETFNDAGGTTTIVTRGVV